jgi:hypothetical protein
VFSRRAHIRVSQNPCAEPPGQALVNMLFLKSSIAVPKFDHCFLISP